MKEEYKDATKKYGLIKVFWKNAYNFEIYENNINLIISDSGNLILDTNFKTNDSTNKSTPCSTKPSFNSYKIQIFSLPKTVMAYIIENCDSGVLRSLHQTCKYFFVLKPYTVCHKFLRVSEDYKFDGNSIEISDDETNAAIFSNKFILFNSYLVSGELCLSKIHQCHAKYIRIWVIKIGITLKEFFFLVGHGNVEILELSEAMIINEGDKSPVALEEILKFLPKIIEISINPKIHTTAQTFITLPKLNFLNKIQMFHLFYFTYFEPYGFCEFIKKNVDSTSEISAVFDPKMDINEAKALTKNVENELKDFWTDDDQKPLIKAYRPNTS